MKMKAIFFVVAGLVYSAQVVLVYAGAVGGPQKFRDWLKADQSASHTVTFKGGELATITASGDEPFTLKLIQDGKTIYSENSEEEDGGYVLDIENTPGSNVTYTLVITSKATRKCNHLSTKGNCEFLLATN